MSKKIFSGVSLFFLLIISFTVNAQEPVRQYKFTMHKTGFYAGEPSVSPSGKWLIGNFNDMGKTAVCELVDLNTVRIAATVTMREKPYIMRWSPDSKYLLIQYVGNNPDIYDMTNGMKKLVTLSHSGYAVFKPQNTLLDPKQKDPEVFVFGEETTYRYTIKGKLLDSIELDDNYDQSTVWYNQLQRNFSAMNYDGFSAYSDKGKYIKLVPVTGVDTYKSWLLDQDGASMTLYDRNGFTRYNVVTGKIIQENYGEEIQAVCLTPDKKNIVYKSPGKLTLFNEKKMKTTVTLNGYYSYLFYTGYGTELVCVNPDEVKIYACKNYLPVIKAAPVVKPTPPVVVKKDPPPVIKPTPAPAKTKWTQPYTVVDFITPKEKDSFYLYSADRGLKYFVKYNKIEGNILWPNPYHYFQYFGFGSEQKYQSYYFYLLDNNGGESQMGTYAYSSAYENKQQMVGGQNFLAKIPEKGQTLTWKNKLYNDEYTLTAKVTDMVYKGKPKTFLVVSRGGSLNGQPIDEALYYQLHHGLTFIRSNGKIVFERSF